jgi:predicted nucleic acid-binding protein
MEWLEQLTYQTVALDTAPLIYFIEEHPLYLPIVVPFFEALAGGRLRAVTSIITLLEVLVLPLKQNNLKLAQQYRNILLNTEGLSIENITPVIAESAAKLRSHHILRTPDALQLATALQCKASVFLTNDMRLPSLPSLPVLTLDNLK